MIRSKRPAALLPLVAAVACAPPAVTTAPAAPTAPAAAFQVPVEYHRLDNGLRVVLSPDYTAPIVTVAVYYNIGFRNEPQNRTGFAHLFEHMMFQGSRNLPKGEFARLIESNGGVLNGSTGFDYTNYFQIIPSHMLDPILWAEADRMRGLDVTQENLTNQQGVVKSEVRENVLNQPYGGFPWLDMPQYANTNWYNAHNFYGDLDDLDAATLEDVQQFFRTFYAPNNAVVVVSGDFQPGQALDLVRRYFADIPAQPQPPEPDISEPRQEAERRASKADSLAPRPALGISYHVPARWTPEWYAMGLIQQILGSGRDSWFYQELVQRRALTSNVRSGINIDLGNMFNYNGPMLWTIALFHDADKPADTLIAALDSQIERLRNVPVEREILDRARVKMRSSFYNEVETLFGFGRVDLLASFALFDDDPALINRLESGFAAVTPALVQRTAQEYLRPTNRTILTIVPAQRGS
jgi:zinc protease